MDKIWQEIHCPISGGGCGGYILIKLNPNINKRVDIVCPKCGHKHRRSIVNGVVHESGRYSGDSREELCPTMAAWTEEPRTEKIGKLSNERDGAVITTGTECRDQFLRNLWFETNGGKE